MVLSALLPDVLGDLRHRDLHFLRSIDVLLTLSVLYGLLWFDLRYSDSNTRLSFGDAHLGDALFYFDEVVHILRHVGVPGRTRRQEEHDQIDVTRPRPGKYRRVGPAHPQE